MKRGSGAVSGGSGAARHKGPLHMALPGGGERIGVRELQRRGAPGALNCRPGSSEEAQTWRRGLYGDMGHCWLASNLLSLRGQ